MQYPGFMHGSWILEVALHHLMITVIPIDCTIILIKPGARSHTHLSVHLSII